jgi:VWFA-related protein
MRSLVFPLIFWASAAVAQDKLVTFDVSIADSHGRPVTDINPDELQLQDNGKHFKIVVFHLNDRKPDTVALAPNQYSNGSLPAPSATAVVLDYVNQTLTEKGYVQARLTEALEHLNPAGYLLLATVTPRGPAWIKTFPSGSSLRPDNTWTPKIGPLLENTASVASINAADRGEFTFQSLDKIAQSLARFPGRKRAVWITEGAPRDVGGSTLFLPVAHRIAAAFATRGIVLFTTSGFSDYVLTPIAEATGGKAFLDKDIAGAIAAQAAPAATYTVGFYPGEWDAKKHKLTLTCTRRGTSVVGPESYDPDAETWTPAAREHQAVNRALANPFDLDGIGLRAAIGPARTPGAVDLQIRIEARDLRLFRQEDSYVGRLSTTIAYYEASGARQVFQSTEREFHFTDEQRQAALRAGIGLADERQIPATATSMRIIAFDPHSNAVGSLTIPLAPTPSLPEAARQPGR